MLWISIVSNLKSKKNLSLVWFGFFYFNGISTFVGYLMPKPCNIYILHICNMWNRHRESEKHEIGSGTKLFITFLTLRFFDMRRERERERERERARHNFFLCWLFYLTPPRAAPHCKLLVWPRRALKIDYLPPASNLNSCFFFQIPSAHRFGAWLHSRVWSYFLSGVFIVTCVIVTSAPRTREHLHSICAPN